MLEGKGIGPAAATTAFFGNIRTSFSSFQNETAADLQEFFLCL